MSLSTCRVCSLPFVNTPGAHAPGVCVACHQREVASKGTMKASDMAKGYNALLKGYTALQGGKLADSSSAAWRVKAQQAERELREVRRELHSAKTTAGWLSLELKSLQERLQNGTTLDKKGYRLLVSLVHPDRWAGAPEVTRQKAIEAKILLDRLAGR